MKYLEELQNGECFRLENALYLLTCDFKANGKKLCYSLSSGSPQWIAPNAMVDVDPIYTLNKDNTIIPVKSYDKKNINIS